MKQLETPECIYNVSALGINCALIFLKSWWRFPLSFFPVQLWDHSYTTSARFWNFSDQLTHPMLAEIVLNISKNYQFFRPHPPSPFADVIQEWSIYPVMHFFISRVFARFFPRFGTLWLHSGRFCIILYKNYKPFQPFKSVKYNQFVSFVTYKYPLLHTKSFLIILERKNTIYFLDKSQEFPAIVPGGIWGCNKDSFQKHFR